MPDYKIIIISADIPFSEAAGRAFLPAGVQPILIASCDRFPMQNKPMYSLVLLDMDCLGAAKVAEMKAFLARIKGLPVIAICDMGRMTNRDTVEILDAGANDVFAKNLPPVLLVAKTKAHLRRGSDNERAASSWLVR